MYFHLKLCTHISAARAIELCLISSRVPRRKNEPRVHVCSVLCFVWSQSWPRANYQRSLSALARSLLRCYLGHDFTLIIAIFQINLHTLRVSCWISLAGNLCSCSHCQHNWTSRSHLYNSSVLGIFKRRSASLKNSFREKRRNYKWNYSSNFVKFSTVYRSDWEHLD
jgi:hypothetical protein